MDRLWLRVEDNFLDALRQFVSSITKPGIQLLSIELSRPPLYRIRFRISLQEVELVLAPLGGCGEVCRFGSHLRGQNERAR